MKTIKGDLVLKENYSINDDLTVEGNIKCEGGLWNIKCGNINCRDLNCWDIDCWDIDCRNIDCRDIDCLDINFYAVAVAYHSFKCKSWKARRDKYIIKCLDGEIIKINFALID